MADDPTCAHHAVANVGEEGRKAIDAVLKAKMNITDEQAESDAGNSRGCGGGGTRQRRRQRMPFFGSLTEYSSDLPPGDRNAHLLLPFCLPGIVSII